MNPTVQYMLRATRSAADQFLRIRERIENAFDEANLDRLIQDAAQKAEATLIQQLERGYPQYGVQGRYTPYRAGVDDGANTVWKVEPIHGDSNLRVASKHFALSVVCLINGRPEHAAVVAPFADDEYIASRGRGAQYNDKRMRVSKVTAVAGTRLAMSLPADNLRQRCLPAYLTLVEQLTPQLDVLTAAGSGLMDVLEASSGRADSVFVPGIEEQDLLVGQLFLKEAGALIGAPNGQPSVKADGLLMAAGPRLYKALLKPLSAHF